MALDGLFVRTNDGVFGSEERTDAGDAYQHHLEYLSVELGRHSTLEAVFDTEERMGDEASAERGGLYDLFGARSLLVAAMAPCQLHAFGEEGKTRSMDSAHEVAFLPSSAARVASRVQVVMMAFSSADILSLLSASATMRPMQSSTHCVQALKKRVLHVDQTPFHVDRVDGQKTLLDQGYVSNAFAVQNAAFGLVTEGRDAKVVVVAVLPVKIKVVFAGGMAQRIDIDGGKSRQASARA